MSGRQHVGAVADAPEGTEDLSKAQRAALAALAKPIPRERGPKHDYGDGDLCPLVSAHGKMFVLPGTGTQWCGNVDHDGRPKSAAQGGKAQERSLWPVGDMALAEALRVYTVVQEEVPA